MSKSITTSLNLTGMHCSSCANILTKAISKVPGVISAQVTHTTDKATINYDPDKINWQALKKAASSLGSYQIILSGQQLRPQTLKLKLIISIIFSLVIIFGDMLKLPREIIFILTSFVMFYSGREFFTNAWAALKKLTANMDTLIAMGTGAAYIYSTAVIFSPQPAYFETAAAIITLILLGRYLEAKAKGKASEAIKKLLNLQVKKAILFSNGKETEVDINQVKKGDQLLIKPGAKIPVDAIIVKGQSYLDESLVTGESVPVLKKPGDKVIGSTINKKGLLIIQATGVGEDTLLANIVKLVNQAQSSKAPIQKLADKVSAIFVPTVLLLSLLAFLVWHFVFGLAFSPALAIAITVLIVSCPCALGLATPISIMVGTGRGAQNGILIKNAEKLQIAGQIKAIVFDKTGTLTKGEPAVTNVTEIRNLSKTQILQIAASLEKNSEHPLAKAIIQRAKQEKIGLLEVKNFRAIPGKGIAGMINAKSVLLGTRRLMEENKIDFIAVDERIKQLENQGKTVMILAMQGKIAGLLGVADVLKEHASEAVKDLQKMGKEVAILTGDNKRVGRAIAGRVGADQVLAEVLPQEKAQEIKKLQARGDIVAMVGDGINDAPALAQADLGIALGSGTDVAMETGEIILVKNDLRDVIKAIDLSKYTLKKIKQNLFWSFFYNIIGIPIAAGLLYPFTGWLLNPAIAAAAMAFSSVSVVSNSLLMKRYKSRL